MTTYKSGIPTVHTYSTTKYEDTSSYVPTATTEVPVTELYTITTTKDGIPTTEVKTSTIFEVPVVTEHTSTTINSSGVPSTHVYSTTKLESPILTAPTLPSSEII